MFLNIFLTNPIRNSTLYARLIFSAWWRHQMATFSALLDLCAGNSPVTGELHTQRPVKLSFDAFFDMRLNKRLSKQSFGWWFETPLHSLWRHCIMQANDSRSIKFVWNVFINQTWYWSLKASSGGIVMATVKLVTDCNDYIYVTLPKYTRQWWEARRMSVSHGVSDHRQFESLFKGLLQFSWWKASKLLVPCGGNPPATGGFLS